MRGGKNTGTVPPLPDAHEPAADLRASEPAAVPLLPVSHRSASVPRASKPAADLRASEPAAVPRARETAAAPRADETASARSKLLASPELETTAILVSSQLLASISAQARAEFPAECCGYLTGPADAHAVDALVPCRNAQADGDHPLVPERGADAGFVIAGAELFAFAKSFDGPTPARIVYHSHTNGRAYFSDVDREMAAGPEGPAYPVQHLVVGLDAERITEVAQFAWSDEARDFIEVARWRP